MLEISMRQLHSITERELDGLLKVSEVAITVDTQAKYKLSLFVNVGVAQKGSRVSPDDIQATGKEGLLVKPSLPQNGVGTTPDDIQSSHVEYQAKAINSSHDDTQPIKPGSILAYNPAVHKTGARVLVRQGKVWIETVVPELDADGNRVW